MQRLEKIEKGLSKLASWVSKMEDSMKSTGPAVQSSLVRGVHESKQIKSSVLAFITLEWVIRKFCQLFLIWLVIKLMIQTLNGHVHLSQKILALMKMIISVNSFRSKWGKNDSIPKIFHKVNYLSCLWNGILFKKLKPVFDYCQFKSKYKKSMSNQIFP